MPRELPEPLAELAWVQRGVLSRRQATGAGMSGDVIRSRLRQGHWQRLHSGVYAIFSGEPDRAAWLWAAVLRAGAGAMLSHLTAAEVDGLADQPSSLIHVSVPGSRHLDPMPGIILHRRDQASQLLHPAASPPRTRIEETVLDLADLASTADDAYGWATRALGRRLTTRARLGEAVLQRKQLRWRQELTAALAEDGVDSSLEYRYLRDVERPHRLPRGVRQAPVRRGGRMEYRDVLYEEQGLAVELDGRAAHPGDTRWRDIRRDNAAAADGVVTLRYGWLDVSQHPCQVAAQVAAALQTRGYSGSRPCSAQCAIAAPSSAARPRASLSRWILVRGDRNPPGS